MSGAGRVFAEAARPVTAIAALAFAAIAASVPTAPGARASAEESATFVDLCLDGVDAMRARAGEAPWRAEAFERTKERRAATRLVRTMVREGRMAPDTLTGVTATRTVTGERGGTKLTVFEGAFTAGGQSGDTLGGYDGRYLQCVFLRRKSRGKVGEAVAVRREVSRLLEARLGLQDVAFERVISEKKNDDARWAWKHVTPREVYHVLLIHAAGGAEAILSGQVSQLVFEGGDR